VAQNLALEYLDLQNLRAIEMFPLLLLFEIHQKDFLFLLQIPPVYKLLFSASGGLTPIYWMVTTNCGGNVFLVFIGQGELSALIVSYCLSILWFSNYFGFSCIGHKTVF